MEQSNNIFDTAAKKLSKKGKKAAKNLKETPRAPIPDSDPPKTDLSQIRTKDPEIRDMMKKIHAMRQDLQNKMENIYKHSGLTPESLKNFLDNPKNFAQKDWEFIQQNKNILEEKVWETLGEELKPITRYVRENVAGERKGKTLGARKKWIPMH